ncbi:Hypothetical_protein [Hexamita inflata]|uniref:Hypothetical_protein n=1 Tax=Hexamita inflata TaxID=28002 RepID=A0AA86PI78_9EUKA|nr:Hypothetical protein HINF_LOCUS26649 [Hexamita inflata]CAI9939008.1 Hypothetical protein HINF_LOCUS26653 [Hexamita inflata]
MKSPQYKTILKPHELKSGLTKSKLQQSASNFVKFNALNDASFELVTKVPAKSQILCNEQQQQKQSIKPFNLNLELKNNSLSAQNSEIMQNKEDDLIDMQDILDIFDKL